MGQSIRMPEIPIGALFEDGWNTITRKIGATLGLGMAFQDSEETKWLLPGDVFINHSAREMGGSFRRRVVTSYLAGRTAVAVIVERPGKSRHVAMDHMLHYFEAERRAAAWTRQLLKGMVSLDAKNSTAKAVIMTPGKEAGAGQSDKRLVAKNPRLIEAIGSVIQEKFDGMAFVEVYPYKHGLTAKREAGMLAIDLLPGGGVQVVAGNDQPLPARHIAADPSHSPAI